MTDPAVKSVFTDRLAPLLKAGYLVSRLNDGSTRGGGDYGLFSWAAGLRAWSITQMI